MTVPVQTIFSASVANGVTTSFPYAFKITDSEDLQVSVDGVVQTTGFTVSGVGNELGGNVVFSVAPANGAKVLRYLVPVLKREVDYQQFGDWLAEVVNNEFDRIWLATQAFKQDGLRALKLPVDTEIDQVIALDAADRANKAIIFDADGNVTVSNDDYADQLANVTAQAAAAAVSAASASTSASTATTQASNASTSASTASTQASTATTQAGIATTKAGEAATSASSAASSATTATTAKDDALAIYGSISAVNTAATNASNSASAAATSATNAANSATASANSATAADASATAAAVSENAAEAAYNASIAIYGSLGAVQAAQSSASASATAASDSATTAIAQAAAAAASALSAGSVVSQDLSAIDRTVFAATIVDTFLYDTAKDSDGGAWRHRCGHTSWEAETLSGNWLGSAANEAAARAISGATTGSYYYDTTALGFYTLNAGSGKTATYRGNVRQFPAKVLITVEAARVVLWDLTQAGAPMWGVYITTVASSCVAANGLIALGRTGSGGLYLFGFPDDALVVRSSSVHIRVVGGVGSAGVHQNSWTTSASISTNYLVNSAINDVAMTVLPTAPVDVATGLPVPTIAVATDGNATYSTSVIKDDGTVVNVASDSTGTAVGVEFDGLALKVIRSDGNVYYWNDVRALTTGASVSATVSASTTPAALGTASKQAKRALSSSTGLTLMRRNQLTLASSMLAYITKDYTSGWLPGDIRGAWLADTVAETLTGTELVTNGTFATDTSGWTTSNATFTAAAGQATLTATSSTADACWAYATFTTVAGKTYTISGDLAGGANYSARYFRVGTYNTAADLGSATLSADGKYSVTFTATGTTTYVSLGVYDSNYPTTPGTAIWDNISCRIADVDRSVKAKGLQAFGSLTKAAVASGAALMGYSGFSAANYLEQPYNSDLDFGTGDFCIMGWAKFAATAAKEVIFCRDSPTTGKLIRLQVDVTTSYLSASAYDGTTTRTATGAAAIDDATWKHVLLTYSAGTLTIYVNGVSYATATGAALLTLNNATAVCNIGVDSQHANPATNGTLALWRAGATVPTAEQIAHIYETEKALFEVNAQCCLAGTSNAVTALAYDEETDLLHVGTSYGRSAFKGLVRVASEATPVGAITALSASAGVVVQGGASGADVYVPAYTLREELLRDAEQMAKFGQNLIAHDFTATASQTTFTLPVGWEIVAVYQQGSIKRETTSWSRSFDGFKWSVVLGTGATVSDWISILAKRV